MEPLWKTWKPKNPDDYPFHFSFERRQVFLILGYEDRPMSPSDVADQLGYTSYNPKRPGKYLPADWRRRRALRALMKTMAKDGQICRLSFGQYILWSERSKYPAKPPRNTRTLILDMFDEYLDDHPEDKPLFRLAEFAKRYPDRKPQTARNILTHMTTFGVVERVAKGTWEWTGEAPLDQYEVDW